MWLVMLLLNLNIYPKSFVVVETDTIKDVVVCEDYNGDTWSFEGVEDWQEGDICSAIMWGKGTVSIYDDEFVMCRYGGKEE